MSSWRPSRLVDVARWTELEYWPRSELGARKGRDDAHSRHIVASAWTDGSKALSISENSRSVNSIGAENVRASMWPLRTVGYRHSAFATVRAPIRNSTARGCGLLDPWPL